MALISLSCIMHRFTASRYLTQLYVRSPPSFRGGGEGEGGGGGGGAAPSRPQKAQRTLTSAASNIPLCARARARARACLRVYTYMATRVIFFGKSGTLFYVILSLSRTRRDGGGVFRPWNIRPRGRKLRRGSARDEER